MNSIVFKTLCDVYELASYYDYDNYLKSTKDEIDTALIQLDIKSKVLSNVENYYSDVSVVYFNDSDEVKGRHIYLYLDSIGTIHRKLVTINLEPIIAEVLLPILISVAENNIHITELFGNFLEAFISSSKYPPLPELKIERSSVAEVLLWYYSREKNERPTKKACKERFGTESAYKIINSIKSQHTGKHNNKENRIRHEHYKEVSNLIPHARKVEFDSDRKNLFL